MTVGFVFVLVYPQGNSKELYGADPADLEVWFSSSGVLMISRYFPTCTYRPMRRTLALSAGTTTPILEPLVLLE